MTREEALGMKCMLPILWVIAAGCTTEIVDEDEPAVATTAVPRVRLEGGGGGGGGGCCTVIWAFNATAATCGKIELGWSTNGTPDHYVVTRSGLNTGPLRGTTFTETGVPANTTYTYQVTAYDANNYALQSLAATARTPACVNTSTLASSRGFSIGATNGIATLGSDVYTVGTWSGSSQTSTIVTKNGTVWWGAGGDGLGNAWGNAIAAETRVVGGSTNTNVYVTGKFTGTVQFGTTALTAGVGTDLFLVKIVNGAVARAIDLGSLGDDEGMSVALDASGWIYLAGTYTGSIDLGGTCTPSPGSAAATLPADYAVVQTTTNPNAVGFLARFDMDYLMCDTALDYFAESGSSSDGVVPRKVVVLNDTVTKVAVIGSFTVSATIGGSTHYAAGGSDIFAALYQSDGLLLWSSAFGTTSDEFGEAIAFSPNGHSTYLTGEYTGALSFNARDSLPTFATSAVFVARFDDGNYKWQTYLHASGGTAHAYGMTGTSAGLAITGDTSAPLVFAADTSALPTTGTAAFVAAIKDSGSPNLSWSRGSYGGTSAGTAIALDSNANLAVAGDFQSYISFGVDTHYATAGGFTAAFLQ